MQKNYLGKSINNQKIEYSTTVEDRFFSAIDMGCILFFFVLVVVVAASGWFRYTQSETARIELAIKVQQQESEIKELSRTVAYYDRFVFKK